MWKIPLRSVEQKTWWGDYDVFTTMSCLVPAVSDLGELMFGGSRRDHSATGFPTDSNGIATHFFRDLKLYTVGWSARSRKCEYVIQQKKTIWGSQWERVVIGNDSMEPLDSRSCLKRFYFDAKGAEERFSMVFLIQSRCARRSWFWKITYLLVKF